MVDVWFASSSSLAGVSPVRVAVRGPGSRLAVSSGNGRCRSPASSIPFGGVCNRAVRNVK